MPSVIETLSSEPEASPRKRAAAVQLMDQLLRARLLQVTVCSPWLLKSPDSPVTELDWTQQPWWNGLHDQRWHWTTVA